MPIAAREALENQIATDIAQIKEAGTYKAERILTGPQGGAINVSTSDKPVVCFCANNYLGLANSPELAEAAKAAIDKYGYGLSSVRFICGCQTIHKELEQKIADFYGTKDTILYSSCFDANGGLFEPLLTAEDAIISDALNHASIIDGVRLCKAKRFRYDHMDMKSLEEQLKDAQSQRHRMIVTDGVFSMDGDVAPLAEICDLADKYNALVVVDESHALGVIGKTGRGTVEYCNVMDRVDIITGTFGKAMGGAMGGFTTANSARFIEMLRQKSRPYLFSNSLAPAVCGATVKAFDLLMNDNTRLAKLQANTARFRKAIKAAGFTVRGDDTCPIAPVMINDAAMAGKMADALLAQGIYVTAFSFPVVPRGQARIRTQLSAAHTDEQIDMTVAAFTQVGEELGLIQ
ncbi:Glycine-C-acetyltransferase [Carpediemonas membranifera]|uniref:Glycine-C-acetyltransferase n=1 Tax=Carpediemonas membranifera TaxID=201153 RepID=A0A8J6E3V7_9EUKA|nr:Glycine-C-acetyltransferase [Carpediemonas membranifera]|eukprot:KAG9393682.1 Glycine-C-acetyltransferase [Carpediemonas membranifera]